MDIQKSEYAQKAMDLEKHIIDTIKEWQLKIGYREGNMKLYYPGESLASMLGIAGKTVVNRQRTGDEENGTATEDNAVEEATLMPALEKFCKEVEPRLGRIQVTGNYERYCLDISAKGCAYVAAKVEEPRFLKLFLAKLTHPGSRLRDIRECFASYAAENGTAYREEAIPEEEHTGYAFYFENAIVEEYVYLVEENEFGLTYHRFTRSDYEKLCEKEAEKI